MKKMFFTSILLSIALSLNAQSIALLDGYDYGRQDAPKGNEWENPELLSLNKLQPHAYFFDFANTNEALNVLPSYSSYWVSLDGQWKFNWAPDPASRPVDFYQNTYDVSSWDDLTVPSCWMLKKTSAGAS